VTGGYPAAPVAEVFDTALKEATNTDAANISDVLCRSRSAYRGEFLTTLERIPA
jgi:hypothetical protein